MTIFDELDNDDTAAKKAAREKRDADIDARARQIARDEAKKVVDEELEAPPTPPTPPTPAPPAPTPPAPET